MNEPCQHEFTKGWDDDGWVIEYCTDCGAEVDRMPLDDWLERFDEDD